MIPNIPIGGLKREEIYLFMSGIYVALSWTLHYTINVKYFVVDKELLTAYFLLAWLSVTILIHFVRVLINMLITWILRRNMKDKSVDELRRIFDLEQKPVYYVFDDFIENTVFVSRISILLFISIGVSMLPILCLASQAILLSRPMMYISVFMALLMMIFFIFRACKALRLCWAIAYLHEKHPVIVVNRQAVGVEGAKFYSNHLIEDIKKRNKAPSNDE